jgi:hypothetical protein
MTTLRDWVVVPPPQVELQSVQVFQLDTMQSTGHT